MFTRKDYISKNCTHDQYYAQLVGDTMINHVKLQIGKKRILASTDTSFNDIPLKEWDALVFYVNSQKMRELGESPTLATKVCIAKQAARMIKEGVNHASN